MPIQLNGQFDLASATEAIALASDTQVASFTDTDTSDTASSFTATIDWGDGVTTTGATVIGSNGSFTIEGGHTYADEGFLPASVTIVRIADGSQLVMQGGVTVDDNDNLTGFAGPVITGNPNQALTNITVATFTDTTNTNALNTTSPASDFTSSIDWGDGTTSVGTISGSGGHFTVTGSHTYATAGQFTVTTFMNDDGGGENAFGVATTQAGIGFGGVETLQSATEFIAVPTGTQVATFFDNKPGTLASDYTATIDWGDGTTTAGVVSGSGGSFTVTSASDHSYSDEENFTLTANIKRTADNVTITASGTVSVDENDVLDASGTTIHSGGHALSNVTVATFTDTEPDNVAGDFVASIDWGDGTTTSGTISGSNGAFTVKGSHTYAQDGQYTVGTVVRDDPAPNSTANASATTTAIVGLSAGEGTSFSINEGAPTGAIQVATFSDGDQTETAAAFTASINWGDGTTTAGVVSGSNGSFTVSTPVGHTYADEGGDTITTTVTRTADQAHIAMTGTAIVGEADSLGISPGFIGGNPGLPFTNLQVATFTTTYTGNVAADFLATIAWGDGTTTTGTISGSNGNFTVTGSHTYVTGGVYTFNVAVADDAPGTATVSGNGIASINLSGHVVLTSATEHIALASNTTVATFQDNSESEPASNFSAVIDWGDGVTSAGTVVGLNGNLSVQGSHTYADEGSDNVSVTLTHTTDQAKSIVSGSVGVGENDSLTGHSTTFSAVVGTGFSGIVATFTDTDQVTLANDLVATIDWGDGVTTSGNVSGGNGAFSVSGSHTYSSNGPKTVTATLVDDAPGTASANATSTANVDAPPVAQNGSASGNEDAAIPGQAVATDADNTQAELSYALVGSNGGAQHGTVSMDAHGAFTYTPAANFNGTDSFSFNATDNRSATSNTAAISITVNSVNDAPSGADKTITTNEDTPYTFATADFGFTDPNDSPANNLAAVKMTTLPSGGTFTDNGIAVTTGQFISAGDIAGGKLVFTPSANANGNAFTSFTFQVQDDGGTANAGVNLDQSPNTITFNVTPVNDAPSGANKTITTNEDTPYTFATADFGFTDPNDNPANNLAAVKMTTLPVAGTLTDNGVAVTAGQLISAGDITSGKLVFTPSANANGTPFTSFTFQVQDDGGTANGGVNLDQSPNTITFNVTPVDDPPVFAGIGGATHTQATEQTFVKIDGAVTVTDVELDARNSGAGDYAGASLIIGRTGTANPEDTYAFNTSGALFTVDNTLHALLANGKQFATFNIPASGAQAGTIAINFNSLNTPATTALVDDVMQHITYKNQSDTPPANVTLHWTFNDGNFDNSQGSGGNKFDTANRIVDITPVDDAPVAQDGSATGNEDTTINGALVASDVDSPSLTFARVTNAAHGNVTVNADGTFSYTPNADFNGGDSFTFKANDGSLDSNVATISLTINPVDDPPVIISDGGGDTANLSVPENTTAVTTVVATDIDSPTITYSIVGGVDAGKFQIDASTGALSFVTAPDFENPTDTDHNNSYIVQVRASDGILSDDQLITVAVTDVNETVPKLHWFASVDAGAHSGVFGPTEAPIDHWVPQGIGDFNGDGTSDLAWYDSFGNTIDIWKLSNGGFGSDAPTGSHPAGYQPVGFGDYNGDHTSDVLWFNPTTRDVDLWKISNGQWAGSVDIGMHPAGATPVLSGDFNGDGTSDVLWFNASTRDAEVWKISNGQWAGSVDIGTHPAGYVPALAGDFNGDGTSDIAWYNATTGDMDIWKISNGQWAGTTSLGAHPAGYQPLGAGDFNKDGTSDIAWYNPTTNDIDIWLIKNGQWAGSVSLGSHPAGSTAVGVGDFDHNGVSDIMWVNNTTGHIENWLLAFS